MALQQQINDHPSHRDHKLGDLQPRDVSLPPQLPLHLWTETGQEVVKVHYDMHNVIQEPRECQVLSECPAQEHEGHKSDADMVVDVQERHLILLATKDHKDRVTEIKELQQEVVPIISATLEKVWF